MDRIAAMDVKLNPSQRIAVETSGGPVLVLAGAGTGKTRVVTLRIARLISAGILPERILAVTFTNRAAQEMQQRIAELLGAGRETRPEISTFHSLCVRILRRHATKIGYPERFVIYDSGDQESLARQVLREIRVHDAQLRPRDMLAIVSRWKGLGIRPAQAGQVAENDREHLAAAAYRRYQDALRRAGGMDFDDLLLHTDDLLENHADARSAEQNRFDHILIDEYQDTNEIQYRIVRALAERHRNICVVGDDDQAIYAFRGSDVRHILAFPQDWDGALTIRLEENYRSTESIIGVANQLIRCNRHRHPKVLQAARPGGARPRIEQHRDETEEANWVVHDIARLVTQGGTSYSDCAVLFRTNEQPRLFETEFRRAKIPYILLGSRSFFDRREVRDLLAYLKLLHNIADETALRRIINTPARGISNRTIDQLLGAATERGVSLWRLLCEVPSEVNIGSKAAEACRRFVGRVLSWREECDRQTPLGLIQMIIQDVDYRGAIQRACDDEAEFEMRWDTVEELVNAVGVYESAAETPSIGGFLDEIATGMGEAEREKEKQLQQNAVLLMTLHAAKGLEFPYVYMVGLEEGVLPHHRSIDDDAAIDEERRLAYVGVTRAEDQLTLSLALSRMRWGRPMETQPSRFLFEMTGISPENVNQESKGGASV